MRGTWWKRGAALAVVGGVACAGLVLEQAKAALPDEPCNANGVNVCRDVVLVNQSQNIRGVQIIGLLSQGPDSPDQVLSACLPVDPNAQASGQYANLATYLALQVYSTSDCSDAGRRLGHKPGVVPPPNSVTVPEHGTVRISFDDTGPV